ncbi:penicillin-binding protein 2 [Spirulina major CS-329]|uniref:peptidoglycan D,D-transpeptidase FtsI family protein n=1 Tax=Spirulina TaxID=1154 RepID=UPI00233088EB|nr:MULTISPECIES: penicillin-binding protein 2 [Spirulina]MDB9493139.1 penicillin-binding protein 2 [Spirulina subsalsa CS-330]MDB9501907.1 penicillin-binding protein 2 [Spirulina major CS-329]
MSNPDFPATPSPPDAPAPPFTPRPYRLQPRRLWIVWGLLAASLAGLGFNLYRLQILRAPDLMEQARNQQMTYMRPYIPRREIVDRAGNILATDRLVYTLYAHPNQFPVSREAMAQQLARPLTQDAEALLKTLKVRDSGIPLAANLSEETADQIRALKLNGLELIRQYSRLYPQQELVSDVVGYVDLDHKGQAGLEYTQEKALERNLRTLQMSRAGNGALMPDHIPSGLLGFDDQRLQLTVDMRLQRVARSLLKQQVETYKAKRGAVLVMNVNDGALLALACEPTFDPNEYSKFDLTLFKNWAVTDLYEPGSTFKPINMAIALEAGAIQSDDTFYDAGKIEIDTWEIANHDYESVGGRGDLNLGEILSYSSNVAMVDLVQQMDPKVYYEALKNLDLTVAPAIELPGAAAGQLKSAEQFIHSPVEAATTAFGQGFSLTPLKLAQLQAAIANGGLLVTPHLVRGLVDAENTLVWEPTDHPVKRVFSPATTEVVLDKMAAVIDAPSGQSARISGYRLGGKSGTAEKASPDGGYFSDRKIVSFFTILPLESPQYLVLVVIDEPQGEDLFGSTVAAPLVKSITEALIAIEGLPPSSP